MLGLESLPQWFTRTPAYQQAEEMHAADVYSRRRAAVEALGKIDADELAEKQAADVKVEAAKASWQAAAAQAKALESAYWATLADRQQITHAAEGQRHRHLQTLKLTADHAVIDAAINDLADEEQVLQKGVFSWVEDTRTNWETGKKVVYRASNYEEISRKLAAVRAGIRMLNALRTEAFDGPLQDRIDAILADVATMGQATSTATISV